MTVTFGSVTFDHVDYDAERDILVLHVGRPRPVDDYDVSDEGHPLRFEAGALVGIEIIGAGRLQDVDGRIVVTLPDGETITSRDVERALVPRTARTADAA